MGNDNRPQVKDRQRKKQASRAKVKIIMTDDVAQALEKAQQDFALIQMQEMQGMGEDDPGFKAKAEGARAALRAAEEEAEKDAVEYVFKNVGRKAFDKLITDHPPTDENREDAKAQGGNPDDLNWNPNTFPVALVAAAIIHPQMDEAEVQEMWDDPEWGGGELQQLFWTALAAQQKSRVLQMGNA